VTTSVSGNTVETLTTLESAHKLNCNVIAFSSGGKVESFCLKNGIEYRKINEIHSPRASFSNYVYTILKVLNSNLPIQKHDITESLDEMENLSKQISSSNLNETNPSFHLANWLSGIPLIYYPWGLQAAAIRFKNSLQENAKTHAIAEDIIEACHNGIVSWEKPHQVQPILIKGKDDYIKTKERWKIIEKYFDEREIKFSTVNLVSGGILSKLITLIYQLDYSTIYLAAKNKIDPSPIHSIDYIKKHIS